MGLDPGSLKTGFGVLDFSGRSFSYVASGIIRIPSKNSLPQRLKVISEGVTELIESYQPDVSAIEDVFFAVNPKSALKLGQARGAAITAAVTRNIDMHEYAARLVKQAVAGTGAATKEQVQYMVKNILKIEGELKEDAADALAVAICHAHLSQNQISAQTRMLGAQQ
jgi:crossover junction endodeoxyribonuclease RuvC